MKLIILATILLLSSIHADELERLGYIVNDITKLRADYSKMSDDYAMCQYKLKDEKEKSAIVLQELKLYSNYEEKEKNYKNRITSLENQIKKLKKDLLAKEKSINSKKEISNNCLKNQRVLNDNPFPALKMKSEYIVNEVEASTYRVNKDANIYDDIDGKVIDKWEKNTSFTSNQKTQKWIKITGFFVEKVWRPADKEMWISVDDAYKRSKAHSE